MGISEMPMSFEIEDSTREMKQELEQWLNSDLRFFNKKYGDMQIAGAYIIYDGSDKIIYVGSSDNLRRRLMQDLLKGTHTLRDKLFGKQEIESEEDLRRYLAKKCKFKVLKIGSIIRAKRAEHFAIGVLHPRYND